jgi:hypothetical protein
LYEGNFENDVKQGFGVYMWPDGDKYSGEWANDEFNGKGEWIFSDGERRVGTFVDDEEHGVSIHYYPDGRQETRYYKAGSRVSHLSERDEESQEEDDKGKSRDGGEERG